MKARAVIFDVYHTLLEIGPPPANAAQRWESLWHATLPAIPAITLEELAVRCDTIIQHQHAAARALGIPHPEILWQDVVGKAVPSLRDLKRDRLDEFLFQHAGLQRTVSLKPGASQVLAMLTKSNVILGIASNAQAYTLRELDAALRKERLDRSLFHPELCFWSFSFGFSKPDPHVYRLLDARLRAMGVGSSQIMMVGDRADNDIQPAQSQGWQTWQLLDSPAGTGPSGNWEQLQRHLGL